VPTTVSVRLLKTARPWLLVVISVVPPLRAPGEMLMETFAPAARLPNPSTALTVIELMAVTEFLDVGWLKNVSVAAWPEVMTNEVDDTLLTPDDLAIKE